MKVNILDRILPKEKKFQDSFEKLASMVNKAAIWLAKFGSDNPEIKTEKMKTKEIEEFGILITMFENGNIYLSTKGDVHIIQAKRIFDVNDDRVKKCIEFEDQNPNDRYLYTEEEMKVINIYKND